jgi:exodeoxyribonuclease-3
MRIATWNVNSVRARHDRLLAFLARHAPDVVCLQELKVDDADFPFEPLQQAGYHAAIHGQKAYNGVAILARSEPTEVERGLDDGQSRLIAARVAGVRVVSAYFPNGGGVGSESWPYKLDWMRRLRAWLDARASTREPLALCGDFNVAPEDRDVAFPMRWGGSVLCHPDARAALDEVRGFGLVDVLRKHHPEAGHFSWWDYRKLAFPKGDGLRIDHVWATEALAGRSRDCFVDRPERKGKLPSDHAPVLADFADE